jgi:hypothetical protein
VVVVLGLAHGIMETETALFEDFKELDDEGDRCFNKTSLLNLCRAKSLLCPKVTEEKVEAIFGEVTKKEEFREPMKLQTALQKICACTDKYKSYDELIEDLKQTVLSESEEAFEAGVRGPIYFYLNQNNKFVERLATIDSSNGLFLITDKRGSSIKSSLSMEISGAVIDRKPDLQKQASKRLSLVGQEHSLDPQNVFLITQHRKQQASGTSKSFLLKANNHGALLKWVEALTNKGAKTKDSDVFVEELSGAAFRVVPLGGSGVGKSTMCNLWTGAMWITENGGLTGYEDEMFLRSNALESCTTADDARMLCRGWGGRKPMFEIMDTPGLFDSAGATTDKKNIKGIVEKLKSQKQV